MRSLLVGALLLTALAGRAVELVTPGGLRAPRVLEVEPLSLADFGGAPAAAVGAGISRAVSGSVAVRAEAGPLPIPAAVEVVERELPLVFRLRSSETLPPRVHARWVGEDGREGSRTVDGKPAPGPTARVRIIGPWPVSSDERGTVYEGRLVLELPLQGITHAGRLSGRIELLAERGP